MEEANMSRYTMSKQPDTRPHRGQHLDALIADLPRVRIIAPPLRHRLLHTVQLLRHVLGGAADYSLGVALGKGAAQGLLVTRRERAHIGERRGVRCL